MLKSGDASWADMAEVFCSPLHFLDSRWKVSSATSPAQSFLPLCSLTVFGHVTTTTTLLLPNYYHSPFSYFNMSPKRFSTETTSRPPQRILPLCFPCDRQLPQSEHWPVYVDKNVNTWLRKNKHLEHSLFERVTAIERSATSHDDEETQKQSNPKLPEFMIMLFWFHFKMKKKKENCHQTAHR